MVKIRNVVVQMDYVLFINIVGDFIFVMSLEVQVWGYKFFYYMLEKLLLCDGKVYVIVELMELCDIKGDYFMFGVFECIDLLIMDVVLLCQDLFFDMVYIILIYMLECIYLKMLVVNDLVWVCNLLEKIFVIEFLDLMLVMLIICDVVEICVFCEEMGDIIIKLFYGNGGVGVFYFKKDDCNFFLLFEIFGLMFCEFFIVQ